MARTRHRNATRRAVVAVLAATLLAAGGLELTLRAGPTRPATCAGKRTAAGRTYRVSYTYDGGGTIPAADTDAVSLTFFSRARRGTPLRVRTVGLGTFRFARLAGAATAGDDVLAAARWGGLAAVGGVVLFRRRRRVAAAS